MLCLEKYPYAILRHWKRVIRSEVLQLRSKLWLATQHQGSQEGLIVVNRSWLAEIIISRQWRCCSDPIALYIYVLTCQNLRTFIRWMITISIQEYFASSKPKINILRLSIDVIKGCCNEVFISWYSYVKCHL